MVPVEASALNCTSIGGTPTVGLGVKKLALSCCAWALEVITSSRHATSQKVCWNTRRFKFMPFLSPYTTKRPTLWMPCDLLLQARTVDQKRGGLSRRICVQRYALMRHPCNLTCFTLRRNYDARWQGNSQHDESEDGALFVVAD